MLFYLCLNICRVQIIIPEIILNENVTFGVRLVHACRETKDMSHFVHANKQNLLKPFLVKPQVYIIEHDHAPNGSFVRLQKRTRSRFGYVYGFSSLLVAAEDAHIADGTLSRINFWDFKQTTFN